MSKKRKVQKSPPIDLPISDIAVLGLISTRNYIGFTKGITGKQIIKEMKQASFPDWVDIKYSTVYNCLSRLEEYGYLTSNEDIDKKSRKRIKLYQISASGSIALHNEIIHYLSTPIKESSPLDLAIGNLGLLSREISAKSLELYSRELEKQIQFLKVYVEGLKESKIGSNVGQITLTNSIIPVINNLLALFERPYRELLARKEWLEEFLQKLKHGKVFTKENLNVGDPS